MAKKNRPVVRVDPEFEKDLKKIAKTRLVKGLANMKPTDLSTAEMTRLLRRTNGYQMSIRELMTKPKRRNND